MSPEPTAAGGKMTRRSYWAGHVVEGCHHPLSAFGRAEVSSRPEGRGDSRPPQRVSNVTDQDRTKSWTILQLCGLV